MLGLGKESARARSAGKGWASTVHKMNRRFASSSSEANSGSALSSTEWSTFTLRSRSSQGRMFEFPVDTILVPYETIPYRTVPYYIVPYGLFHATREFHRSPTTFNRGSRFSAPVRSKGEGSLIWNRPFLLSLLAQGATRWSTAISAIRKRSLKRTSGFGHTLDTYRPALSFYNAFREG